MDLFNVRRYFAYLALALFIAGSIGYVGFRVESVRTGSALWQRAQDRTRRHMADWAQTPKDLGEVMLERFGTPDAADAQALVWTGQYPWKRIVVHRGPAESALEHVVAYDVPPEKLEAVRSLGHGVWADPWRAELSARGDRESLNFLALNLANEVAVGLRTPEAAREFFDKTSMLALAGKYSPYMEGPLFTPRPRPRPIPEWESPGFFW